MKPKELVDAGLPPNCVGAALAAFKATGVIHQPRVAREALARVLADPTAHVGGEYGALAQAILSSHETRKREDAEYAANPHGSAGFLQWGDGEDPKSIQQMAEA